MATILVIEDEMPVRRSITQTLARAKHIVRQADSLAAADKELAAAEPDVVITDVNLGDGSGIDIVRRLRTEGFSGGIIVITAYATVTMAVEAMKLGANDLIQKPLSLEVLAARVEAWLNQQEAAKKLELYERAEQVRGERRSVIGESRLWLDTLRLSERLANVPLDAGGDNDGVRLQTILLLGETGTGKGVLARHIHERACASVARADKSGEPPFVHVNCTALPPTLVESELFGHEKGAFTDAREARQGLFEMADGGTIFLDEISEMPLELQAKLLVVVEQGRFRRVGGSKDRTVRARVIAASNVDLEKRVEDGRFRRDLLYRLNAFTIRIPALREREGDAARIAQATLEQFTRRYSRAKLTLGDGAVAAIGSYRWPGNVRELVNAIQRVAMLCDGPVVQASDLGLPGSPALNGALSSEAPSVIAEPGDLPAFDFSRGVITAEALEKELIVQALRHTGENVSRAARLIGLTRASMRYRMEQYGLNEHATAEAQSS